LPVRSGSKTWLTAAGLRLGGAFHSSEGRELSHAATVIVVK
jgi:hypothetical protein